MGDSQTGIARKLQQADYAESIRWPIADRLAGLLRCGRDRRNGEARGLQEPGDVAGLLRYMRADGDGSPLGDLAALMAGAGQLAGFDDLAQAGAAVADGADGPCIPDAVALFFFGYTCMEYGVGHLAIRSLARAFELVPDSGRSSASWSPLWRGQHARVAAVLDDHDPVAVELRITDRLSPVRPA